MRNLLMIMQLHFLRYRISLCFNLHFRLLRIKFSLIFLIGMICNCQVSNGASRVPQPTQRGKNNAYKVHVNVLHLLLLLYY